MPQMIGALFRDSAQVHQALQALLEMGLAQTRIVTAGLGEGPDVSSISGFRTLSAPDESGAALAGMTNTGAVPGMGLMGEAADDLGSSDLRTGEMSQPNQGSSITVGTGMRRSEARADREGVNELDVDTQPDPDQPALLQRHMNRGGRIRVFGSPGGGTV